MLSDRSRASGATWAGRRDHNRLPALARLSAIAVSDSINHNQKIVGEYNQNYPSLARYSINNKEERDY